MKIEQNSSNTHLIIEYIVSAIFISLSLVSPCLAEPTLKIKMTNLPIEGLQWGMTLVKLKEMIPEAKCKLNRNTNKTECTFDTFHLNKNPIVSVFTFDNYGLDSVSTLVPVIKKPNPYVLDRSGLPFKTFREQILAFSSLLGEPPRIPISEMEDKNSWRPTHFDCDTTTEKINETFDSMVTTCYPNLYIKTLSKAPSENSFKLLDLTFGISTDSDVLAMLKSKRLEHTVFKDGANIDYIIRGLNLEGISSVEISTYENKLYKIAYDVDKNYLKKAEFFEILKKKYGTGYTKLALTHKWDINSDTRDRVEVLLEYSKTLSNIRKITYSLNLISFKRMEHKLRNFTERQRDSEKLKEKAF